MLNSSDSEFYETTKQQALLALRTYPGGLQVGGGIHDGNAKEFLEAGASHVIVTSYVFSDGRINFENLNRLVEVVGKKHLVLDLSCRKKDGAYHIVTDRWQKFVEEKLTVELFCGIKVLIFILTTVFSMEIMLPLLTQVIKFGFREE